MAVSTTVPSGPPRSVKRKTKLNCDHPPAPAWIPKGGRQNTLGTGEGDRESGRTLTCPTGDKTKPQRCGSYGRTALGAKVPSGPRGALPQRACSPRGAAAPKGRSPNSVRLVRRGSSSTDLTDRPGAGERRSSPHVGRQQLPQWLSLRRARLRRDQSSHSRSRQGTPLARSQRPVPTVDLGREAKGGVRSQHRRSKERSDSPRSRGGVNWVYSRMG